MEYWRYGTITEDKKVKIRFLADDGEPIPLANISEWGVNIVTRHGKVLMKPGNITGHNMDNAAVVSETEIQIVIPGNLNPKTEVDIYAVSVIKLADESVQGGVLTDVSDNPVILFRCKRDYD